MSAWLHVASVVIVWPACALHILFAVKRSRKRRWTALAVAAGFVLEALHDVMRNDWSDYAIDVCFIAWYVWQWWRDGGNDDFKKGKKKVTEKVAALANGRLGVQPA